MAACRRAAATRRDGPRGIAGAGAAADWHPVDGLRRRARPVPPRAGARDPLPLHPVRSMLRPSPGVRPSRRVRRAQAVVAKLACAAVCASGLVRTQEPAAEETRAAEAAPAADEPVIAVRAAVVHPISGPPIEQGIVLIQGARIIAVGTAEEVEIPAGATLIEHPDGHVYPGFVDALSRAFAGPAAEEQPIDAGASIADGLAPHDELSQQLAGMGVTTAYVSNRSDSTWRGQGALIRPTPEGFSFFDEAPAAPVHLRMTTGSGPSHPLQRLEQLAGLGREFTQLEAYEKAFTDHEKKLADYQKAFDKFLAWHREHRGDAKPENAKPENAGEAPPAGERRGGRRGRPATRGEAGGPPAAEEPAKGAAEAAKPAAAEGGEPGKAAEGKAAEEKAPERPKFPPEPKQDPAKAALIAVRDGERACFVEVRRADEVERALELAREHGIPRMVLEHASGALPAVDAIAAAGVPVIVDSALPPADDGVPGSKRGASERAEPLSVAVELVDAGVPVAIGSGDVRRARWLPLLAAEAIGQGLPADAALRAITLTPAEILGIADRVGSLEADKLADLVVTSAPLESSDARIVRVIAGGRTVHEAR